MRFALTSAALLIGLLGSQAAHAGLLGDEVTANYYYGDDTSSGNLYSGPYTGVVGTTFTIDSGLVTTYAAVTDAQIILTFDSDGNFDDSVAFNGIVITDSTNSNITGATVDAATTVSSFSASDLSSTSDSVSINLAGISETAATDQIVIDVAFISTPEPLSLSLLGTGLAGVFLARRRKAG